MEHLNFDQIQSITTFEYNQDSPPLLISQTTTTNLTFISMLVIFLIISLPFVAMKIFRRK